MRYCICCARCPKIKDFEYEWGGYYAPCAHCDISVDMMDLLGGR